MYASYTHESDDFVGNREDAARPVVIPIPSILGPVIYDGSMCDEAYKTLYRTPAECGWAKMVKFDHEFIGRKALEAEAANPKHTLVTLEWNSEDVTDVWASLLKDEEPFKWMDLPEDLAPFAEQPYNPETGIAIYASFVTIQS
jgi:hypothetical protein